MGCSQPVPLVPRWAPVGKQPVAPSRSSAWSHIDNMSSFEIPRCAQNGLGVHVVVAY